MFSGGNYKKKGAAGKWVLLAKFWFRLDRVRKVGLLPEEIAAVIFRQFL